MDKNNCFIFSAGAYHGLKEVPQSGDYIIAADAGYIHCLREHITPDLLIGDFDSMPQPEEFENVLRLPVEKDDTDTMAAVKKAIELGYKRIVIYAGLGGERLDHSLANFQTLAYACKQGARAFMYDRDFVYTVIENDKIEIKKTVDDGLVSVFAMDSEVSGVYESGMQYSLSDATLVPYVPVGVSNHFRSEIAEVSCKRGLLLVGWQI